MIKTLVMAVALANPALVPWEVDREQCIARSFIDFGGTRGTVVYTELLERSVFIVDAPDWGIPKFQDPIPTKVFIDDAFVVESQMFRITEDRVAFSITDTVHFKEGVMSGKLISFRVDDERSVVEFTLGLASDAIKSTNNCVHGVLEV